MDTAQCLCALVSFRQGTMHLFLCHQADSKITFNAFLYTLCNCGEIKLKQSAYKNWFLELTMNVTPISQVICVPSITTSSCFALSQSNHSAIGQRLLFHNKYFPSCHRLLSKLTKLRCISHAHPLVNSRLIIPFLFENCFEGILMLTYTQKEDMIFYFLPLNVT